MRNLFNPLYRKTLYTVLFIVAVIVNLIALNAVALKVSGGTHNIIDILFM